MKRSRDLIDESRLDDFAKHAGTRSSYKSLEWVPLDETSGNFQRSSSKESLQLGSKYKKEKDTRYSRPTSSPKAY